MRALVSIVVGLAVFAGCAGAWWFYWPLWRIESQVRTQLPGVRTAHFSSVTYNRGTHAGCGYVDPVPDTARAAGRTHFVLLPDGKVEFDPRDSLRGTTLQQLEALQKHASYLSLVYRHCAVG